MVNRGWLALGFIVALALVGVVSAAEDGSTAINAKVSTIWEITVVPEKLPASGQWDIDPEKSTDDNANLNPKETSKDVEFLVRTNKVLSLPNTWVVKVQAKNGAGTKNGCMYDGKNPLNNQLEVAYISDSGSPKFVQLTDEGQSLYTSSQKGKTEKFLQYKQKGSYADIPSDSYAITVVYILAQGA